MTCCEKCWEEAESMSRYTILTQKECYDHIIKLRETNGIVCSPKEQAGQFWNEELQYDNRMISIKGN